MMMMIWKLHLLTNLLIPILLQTARFIHSYFTIFFHDFYAKAIMYVVQCICRQLFQPLKIIRDI